MQRREFLHALGAGAVIGSAASRAAEAGGAKARAFRIETVRGPIAATELGRTLPPFAETERLLRSEIDQLTIQNPADAFAIRTRPLR